MTIPRILAGDHVRVARRAVQSAIFHVEHIMGDAWGTPSYQGNFDRLKEYRDLLDKLGGPDGE